MKSPFPYFLAFILSLNFYFREIPNPFLFLAIAFSIFPLMDELFSLDEDNPTEE